MKLATGDRLGPYEIISQLGAGGMGEVYRARDTRLNRDVAIKVLPGDVAADSDRVRRLQQEAQAVAALNHPHICQIYDVGPTYLVLEYIEGEPPRGPMAAGEAVRLAIQIASALEAAHRRGILHRDLKPANIIQDRSSSAKVLDFGLAKLIDTAADVTRTMDGMVVGTVAYMSPEQAEGLPLDERSDIFSFGAVLYELLTGRRAFDGTASLQVLDAVRRASPPPTSTVPALDRIVRRCLEKRSGDRFGSMTAVRQALEEAGRQLTPAREIDAQPSIAVLPFANMSADPENEYFSDGLAEEIINALTHVVGLKVIARTSAFAFKGKHEDVRRIADTLGVAHVLEGSVRKAGNRLRVTAQLIAAADGAHLWSERYERELTDVFAIQDEIALAITSALQVKLAGRAAEHTPGPAAHEAILRGRHHRQRGTPEGMIRARECYRQAIALDPKYAAPHAELALADFLATINGGGSTLIEAADLIRSEARLALALDPAETNPHAVLGGVAAALDYDWSSAAEHFRKAVSGRSVSADSRWAHACLYLLALGRRREAMEEMRQAVDQNPLNVVWRAVLGNILNSLEMYDRALEELHKARELDESSATPHFILAETYLATGRIAEAVVSAEKAYSLMPSHSMCWGFLAAALARSGQNDRASALLRKHGESPTPVWGRVWYHLLRSEIDEAAHWYAVTIEQRELFAVMFPSYPVVAPLRASHHWPRLATMMNLPPVQADVTF